MKESFLVRRKYSAPEDDALVELISILEFYWQG